MRIFIKTMDGKIVTVEAEPTWPVDYLETHLDEIRGTPCYQQSLFFNKMLSGDKGPMFVGGKPCNVCSLSEYSHFTREKAVSEEAKTLLELGERALVVGKCSEADFWLAHGKRHDESAEEVLSRLRDLKLACEPTMTKLAKLQLKAYAEDVKGKMGSAEATSKLSRAGCVSANRKCSNALYWVDHAGANATESGFADRLNALEDECEPTLAKLPQHTSSRAKLRLKAYAEGMKERMESYEAKSKLSPAEKASVVEKCSEVLYWMDHAGAAVVKSELTDRLSELKGQCGPALAKLL